MMTTEKTTGIHVLNLLKLAPTPERDKDIIKHVPLIIEGIRVWGVHLQEALTDSQRMYMQFGKDPVVTCEEGFLENQCLAIGCLSR